jgi:hypothetical protein
MSLAEALPGFYKRGEGWQDGSDEERKHRPIDGLSFCLFWHEGRSNHWRMKAGRIYLGFTSGWLLLSVLYTRKAETKAI